jgi:uncharacterized protein YraI
MKRQAPPKNFFRLASLLTVITAWAALAWFSVARLQAAQLPTETLQPTATFGGPTVFSPEQVNVRTGPHVSYEQVGVMVAGQTAPAVGRSPGSEWIQIEYPGAPGGKAWVLAVLVALREGTIEGLPVVEPPPTATLPPTETALPGTALPGTPLATRLPTFTPGPPVVQPTFQTPDLGGGRGIPPALLIIVLFVIGVFAGLVALLRQRA